MTSGAVRAWACGMLGVFLGLTALPRSAGAEALYWDGNGAVDPNPAGNGTWDATSTSNWNAQADYGGAYGAWAQGSGEARFPALGGATGVVTIAGTVSVSQITMATNTANQLYVLTNGTIELAGAALIAPTGDPAGSVAPSLRLYSRLVGSAGLTVSNRFNVLLYGVNTYSGTTTLGNASAKVTIVGASALPATTILRGGLPKDGDIVIANGVTSTVAGVETNILVEGDTAANSVLIMDRASGTSVWSLGTSSREIGLVKRGGYTQVFAGDSARTESLRVEGGELVLSCASTNKAVASTRDSTHWSKLALAGGTLRLDRSEQIQDTAVLTMTGGVFNLNGFSETLSNLTIAADSLLDFGNGSATNTYRGAAAWSAGKLSIANWTGKPGKVGGTDQLRFAQPPGDAFLGRVSFSGHNGRAVALPSGAWYEIVPGSRGTVLFLH